MRFVDCPLLFKRQPKQRRTPQGNGKENKSLHWVNLNEPHLTNRTVDFCYEQCSLKACGTVLKQTRHNSLEETCSSVTQSEHQRALAEKTASSQASRRTTHSQTFFFLFCAQHNSFLWRLNKQKSSVFVIPDTAFLCLFWPAYKSNEKKKTSPERNCCF